MYLQENKAHCFVGLVQVCLNSTYNAKCSHEMGSTTCQECSEHQVYVDCLGLHKTWRVLRYLTSFGLPGLTTSPESAGGGINCAGGEENGVWSMAVKDIVLVLIISSGLSTQAVCGINRYHTSLFPLHT